MTRYAVVMLPDKALVVWQDDNEDPMVWHLYSEVDKDRAQEMAEALSRAVEW